MLIVGAICDKCGKYELFTSHRNKGEVVRDLRVIGWSIGKGKHGHNERTLCPRCRKKGGAKQ